ncbi:hypothetical protein Bca52824_070741 [Brassica carinata]|uniref:1-aminocyclopropane-1-carboxylate synthase n=1 Tax=Brassica carinata TaxID=52824 RepID=A0A8X7Q5I2_BRACI|nr:hypothetical protein Bca52824_070741 [Brassica carinata]
MKQLSTKVTSNAHGQDSSYFLGWEEYEKNPYDEIKNPNGIIQMGLAENQLCFDLIETWLAKNPDAAGLKKDGQSIFKELALFKTIMAYPSSRSKIVLAAGSTSANETLMFCLAEPGDAFLLPTPYYPGFDRDLKWRTGAEIVPIHCSSSNGFQITESALQQAQKLDLKFVSVMDVLKTRNSRTAKSPNEFMSFTVFQRSRLTRFSRWSNILQRRNGCFGCDKMSSFGLVSSQTQYLLSALLSDKKFTGTYLNENQKRLKIRQNQLVSGLEAAGHLLDTNTFEAELELWKKIVYEVKLNISPGSSCHCTEPGWFRVCFANMSEETLDLAMQRLKEYVESTDSRRLISKSSYERIKSLRKRTVSNWVFRVSWTDRVPDER